VARHNKLGQKGEEAARQYLNSLGYHIVNQNWRSGRYELDMVARHNEMVIAIEVKTRTDEISDFDEVMSANKEKNLKEAVHRYMSSLNEVLDCRIDLLFLETKQGGFNVTHIKDAIGQ